MGKSASKLSSPKRSYPSIPKSEQSFTPYKSSKPEPTNNVLPSLNPTEQKTSLSNIEQPDVLIKSDPAKAKEYINKLSISPLLCDENEEVEDQNFTDAIKLLSNGIEFQKGDPTLEVQFTSYKIKGFQYQVRDTAKEKLNKTQLFELFHIVQNNPNCDFDSLSKKYSIKEIILRNIVKNSGLFEMGPRKTEVDKAAANRKSLEKIMMLGK